MSSNGSSSGVMASASSSSSEDWRGRQCSLSESDGCASLAQVLRSFGAPISEAWAWALVHEACRAMHDAIADPAGTGRRRRRLFLVREAEDVLLHSSGMVHQESFTRRGWYYYYSTTLRFSTLIRIMCVLMKCFHFQETGGSHFCLRTR